jgi:prevent-host-death family protein
MKTMTVTEFKAHALSSISNVCESQEPLVVTKRGHPIVEVVPYRETEAKAVPGKLAHMLAFENDIVTPLGAGSWEAAR